MPLRSLALALGLFAIGSASAATYKVTTAADSGPGSLRQAILDANSGACAFCEISIEVTRIDLASELPPLTAIGVSIDGPRLPAAPAVISGAGAGTGASGLRVIGSRRFRLYRVAFENFDRFGILVERSEDVGIHGAARRNGRDGVAVLDSRIVVINGAGLTRNGGNGVYAARTSRLEISYSTIGADAIDGDVVFAPAPNTGNGIHLHDVTRGSVVGNHIRFNTHHGVLVTGAQSQAEMIGNHFESNGLLAIDLGGDGVTPDDEGDADEGPNGLQNAPVIEAAQWNRGSLRVRGHIRTTPRTRLIVLVALADAQHPSGRGEGKDPLYPSTRIDDAYVTTDDDGFGRFEFFFAESSWRPMRGRYVTALATRQIDAMSGGGATSEFSPTMQVTDSIATLYVTSTSDSGPGTLRAALEDVNTSGDCRIEWICEIAFRLTSAPGPEGSWVIQPATPLPPLVRSGVWLDGATQTEFAGETNRSGPEVEINGALCTGCNGLEFRTAGTPVALSFFRDLVINGFDGHGVYAEGESAHVLASGVVDGCYIGTNAGGTRAVPNGGSGIFAGPHSALSAGAIFDNRFSGRSTRPNVIGGNAQHGVAGEGTVFLDRNRIGTDFTGLYAVGNGRNGVDARGSWRITSNVIAFNRENGVVTDPSRGIASIAGNSIHSNGLLGIDAGGDGVTSANAPVILGAHVVRGETVIRYRLDVPRRTFPSAILVEAFAGSFADASGYGEGRSLMAAAHLTGGESVHEMRLGRPLAGKFVALTATPFDLFVYAPSGNTSEFSEAVQVTADGCPALVPSLVAPEADARTSGLTSFEWSSVPGASLYRLFLMKPGTAPAIVRETSHHRHRCHWSRGRTSGGWKRSSPATGRSRRTGGFSSNDSRSRPAAGDSPARFR